MKIDPTRAAVLALHFERDIVDPAGTFGGLLADGVARRGALARTANLIEAARAAGVGGRPPHSEGAHVTCVAWSGARAAALASTFRCSGVPGRTAALA